MSVADKTESLEVIYADADELCRNLAAGKPHDPELVKRVRERAEKARADVRKRLGGRSIAVDLIREIRDEP